MNGIPRTPTDFPEEEEELTIDEEFSTEEEPVDNSPIDTDL